MFCSYFTALDILVLRGVSEQTVYSIYSRIHEIFNKRRYTYKYICIRPTEMPERVVA